MVRRYKKSLSLCLKASVLLVGLSSVYGRAFAGSCTPTAIPGSYNCAGGALGTDATQNPPPDNPLIVTTSAGFGINTAFTGGEAFKLYSNGGGLTFTDSNFSSITGATHGIVAVNLQTDTLAITTNGTVSGLHGIGIWADNRSTATNLTISAAGVSGTDDGINATNSGTGHLSISASGVVIGNDDIGIVAVNHGTDLTITATEVTGGHHGIVATNAGNSELSITTTGTVTGENGIGIWADNRSSATNLTITTAGVSGTDDGINATNSGTGQLLISTSGKVSSTGNGTFAFGIAAYNRGNAALSITASDTVESTGAGAYAIGIYANNASTGTDLTISTADVAGGYAGIYTNNFGSGSLSITSSGTVEATRGNGIVATNSANGTDLTISAANVEGSSDGIKATHDGSGALTITTSGLVSGGAGGFGIAALNNSDQPTTIDIGAQSLVQGGQAGVVLGNSSSHHHSATLNIDGQVRNLSGLPTDPAIISDNSPTAIHLRTGSLVTGTIDLGNDNDSVNLAGRLNGSVTMNGGNDTLIQVGGATLTGTANGGLGDDTLGFNNMGTVDNNILGTKYFNFENLGIFGGSTILTGAWDFSGGNTTIYGGTLFLDGSLNTDTFTVNTGGLANITGHLNSETATVYGEMELNGNLTTDTLTIASNGLLSGSGQVDGRLINYGTISPGNSIGTLHVNGSVSFMPGSVYQAEIRPNGSSDRIDVNGPVNLQGGTVETALSRSLYSNGQNWIIISASGGVTGRFDGLFCRIESETVDLKLAYNSRQVMLEIVRTPFADFGTTPAGQAVGAGLDEVVPVAGGNMAGFITAMDFGMSRSQIGDALNALSPEIYTSFSAAGLGSAGVLDQAVAQHQAELRQGKALGLTSLVDANTEDHGEWTVWTRAIGSWSERDSNAGYLGYSQELSGVVAGTDRQFMDVLRAGVDLGYTNNELEWNGTEHSGGMQGRHIGLYASAEPGNFFFDVSASYSDFTADANRVIAINDLALEAKSGIDSDAWAGRLEGGYTFTMNSWLLSPVASLEYAHLSQDGLSEHGADFLNMDIEETDADSLASTIGGRFSGIISKGGWQYMPRLDLRWLHQFEDEGTVVTANFTQYKSATFEVTGIAPETDQGVLSLGLTSEYGKNLSLYVDYGLAIADGNNSQSVSGGLSWKF